MNIFLFVGALLAGLSVGMGAFGAHALKAKLSPEMLAIYQTGVQYQMVHALAVIAVAILSHGLLSSVGLLRLSGWLFIVGVILFSGSLYALSLTGLRILGAITPFGGLAFLAGWLVLAIAAVLR